jgi:hypothetical protein
VILTERLRRALGRQRASDCVVLLGSAQIFGRACEAATASMPYRILRQSTAYDSFSRNTPLSAACGRAML